MQAKNKFSEITPEVMALSEMCIKTAASIRRYIQSMT